MCITRQVYEAIRTSIALIALLNHAMWHTRYASCVFPYWFLFPYLFSYVS
jgi:hypothetical protein